MHEPVSMGEIWREWAALIEEWLTGQGEPMSHIFLGKVLGKDLGRFWTGFGHRCNGNFLFYTLGQCDIVLDKVLGRFLEGEPMRHISGTFSSP